MCSSSCKLTHFQLFTTFGSSRIFLFGGWHFLTYEMRWGRVGKITGSENKSFTDLEDAKRFFALKFREKTKKFAQRCRVLLTWEFFQFMV